MTMTMLKVNGQMVEVTAEPSTPLIWILREQLGLVATKYGCDRGSCGACSIHVNGQLVRSCTLPLSAVKQDDQIMTVDGISQSQYLDTNLKLHRALVSA
jgi:isoquinoline 1-oxidoreductase alpha subunit